MELTQLYYFRTVARLEHFTNASEELHITQPSLSKTIARLEEDMGAKLFDREGNRVRLNSFGKALLRHTEKIFIEIEEARREISDLCSTEAGTISIAATLPDAFQDYIKMFLCKYPNIHMYQYQQTAARMKESLENHEIDMALSCVQIESVNIQWQQLFTDDVGIIISKNHPLAGKESINLKELANERFLINNVTPDLRQASVSFCEKAGFIPDIYFEGDQPDIIGELVSKGYGVSFSSENHHKKLSLHPDHEKFDKDIDFLRITDPCCQRITGIATLRGRYLSPLAQKFYSFLIDQFKHSS